MFLTEFEYDCILSGIVRNVQTGKAKLTIEGKGQDARFVMEGPSGKHTLLVESTDLNRLNAHWVTFANHHLNVI